MTRGWTVIIGLIIIAAAATVLVIADRSDSMAIGYRLDMEWSKITLDKANNEISSLKQELEIERVKNAAKDSILVVYKESMKVHSMGLQDANWRLIQLKRLIEDAKEE